MIKKVRAKLNERKGFTLAELLIVVAIIAVLVAIAIPIFNTQLERAREATDAANIRAAYAEVAAAALSDPETAQTATVALKQTQTGWQSASDSDTIAGVALSSIASSGSVAVVYTPGTGGADPTFTIDSKPVKSSFISSGNSGGNTGGNP